MKNSFDNFYLGALRASKLGDLLELEFLFHLSQKAQQCPLQDAYRIRARYLGWKTASLLIDENGDLQKDNLQKITSALEEEPYLLIANRDGDERIYHHLLTCLQRLSQDEMIWKTIKKCTVPLATPAAEEIVRDTLWPETLHRIQTPQVRRAVLTAWLTLLRQGTGSCFATAPAMLVQQQDPLMFLRDLEAILSAGQLRRGSFSVPMSPSSGMGEWRKSFWSLSVKESPGVQAAIRSLGFSLDIPFSDHQTPEQIFTSMLLGHFGLTHEDLIANKSAMLMIAHREIIERSVSEKTKKIRDFEKAFILARRSFCSLSDCALLRAWEYTVASFSDVKVEFGRWNLFVSLGLHPDCPDGIGKYFLDRVQEKLDQTNRSLAQLNHEHQQSIQNIRALETLLNRAENENHHRQLQGEMTAAIVASNHLSQIFDETSAMAEWLSKLFSAFLQQAIDQLQVAFQEVFDPALSDGQYEDSPAGFRLIYKQGRTAAASWERIENERQFVEAVYRFFESLEHEFLVEAKRKDAFTELMTALLQFIRSDLFLEKAMKRARENHAGKRGTPWAYESGGTMQTLVQSYFQLPTLPEEFSRSIGSEEELRAFLKDSREVIQGQGPWLMHSPTHAFILNPAIPEEKGVQFFQDMTLSANQVDFLADRFSLLLPEERRPFFYTGFRQGISSQKMLDIRENFLLGLRAAKDSREELVDCFFYESLPLFSLEAVRDALKRFVSESQLGSQAFENFCSMIDGSNNPSVWTLQELIEMMKKTLLLNGVGPFSAIDWEMKIANWVRHVGLAPPQPFIFGDTNWSDWVFGFVPHFGREQLWRLNRTGLRGCPMREWNHVFQEKGIWTILVRSIF